MEIYSDLDLICPQGARLDPIGAPTDSDESTSNSSSGLTEGHNCHLQEPEETLSASLFSLTTYLAQIQFRLRQVIKSPPEDRNELLEALDEFASKEIPDVSRDSVNSFVTGHIASRFAKQTKLLDTFWSAFATLKLDLCESDYSGCEIDVLAEKIKILVQELGERSNLKLDVRNCLAMTPAALRQKVSLALDEMTGSLNQKDNLLADYEKQLQEMETSLKRLREELRDRAGIPGSLAKFGGGESDPHKISSERGIIDKLLGLFRMLIRVYAVCGRYADGAGDLGNDVPENHWGNLRARLQVAILRVRDLQAKGGGGGGGSRSRQTTAAVLRLLAPAVRDLMQHGLAQPSRPWPPLPPLLPCGGGWYGMGGVHAWRVLLDYYALRRGELVALAPARKLSQSFNLNIAEADPASDEEHLLLTIDQIISLYRTYRRSSDVHFKAFICAALNARKLATWLGAVCRCGALVRLHYLSWSYVAETRFADGPAGLDLLADTDFDLPVDFAIRKFLNIRDMFI